MGINDLKVFETQREDLEIEISQLREFMGLVDNAKIPMDFQSSIKNITSSELNLMETQEKQLSNDIDIMIDRYVEIDREINKELTAKQEDYMLEESLERIREERENAY